MPKHEQHLLRKLTIRMLMGALAAGLAAALFANRIEDTYQARVLLSLTYLRFDQKGMPPGTILLQDDLVRRINYVQAEIMQPLTPQDYQRIFTGDEVVEKLRDAMRERYAAAGLDPGSLTLERVARSLDVVSKVEIQTTQQVKYHGIVELIVTEHDPGIAAEMANLWTAISLDTADRMRNAAREGTLGYLKQRYEETFAKREALSQEAEAIMRDWNPPGMRIRLADLESAVTQLRLKRTQLSLDSRRLEAEIAEIEAALTLSAEKIELRQGLTDAAQRLSEETMRRQDTGKMVVAETLNPLHTDLSRLFTNLQSELAGLRALADALVTEESGLQSETETLRENLARIDRTESDLRLELDAHARHTDVLTMTMHAVELAGANIVPECRIVSRAIPPEEKIAPQRGLIVIVAVFLAAIAVPVHFFGMIALRRYAQILIPNE
jgi:uncharacterized protein involved in exopolysaccharide biosynthesis